MAGIDWSMFQQLAGGNRGQGVMPTIIRLRLFSTLRVVGLAGRRLVLRLLQAPN